MNDNLIIPENYHPLLNLKDTEKAIRLIKEFFQINLSFELNLMRTTAPLFVKSDTGINDNLNGVEKPVSFNVKDMNGIKVEIVQSLAKWKRMALADYNIKSGEGIYTDMNAIRPDEILDNLHSLYVDQWDWERVISAKEQNLVFLKDIVIKIYDVMKRTEKYICHFYPKIKPILPENITFIHTEDMEEMYPELTPQERENVLCKQYGAIFIIGIGADLKNGKPHDGRASDYDDWSTPSDGKYKGLNGDIMVYYPVLDRAFELSSMGIRVDAESLMRQLKLKGNMEREKLLYHQCLLKGELPLTIGGGIGQSRLCMFCLRKAHVGEIQSSIWPDEMLRECRQNNIILL
ncbi:aspartate--ammonia ligase [candidate division KSB1 bacterium]|nr:aspartate--ammonia ligase [candidate division KSB1 bacterium]